MLIDHRTYRVKPGTVKPHLELYEKYGLVPQSRHLGKPVAYMFAESGDLNTIVHMWAYETLDERTEKRARLAADPGWQAYVAQLLPLMAVQESKILNPAPFFNVKIQD